MRYTPFFCEENIWHLASDRRELPGGRLVVLVLGEDPARPAVAVWAQRAAGDAPCVVWDYHVVLAEQASPGQGWEVYDLDTMLGCPVPAAQWIAASFPVEVPGLAPRFRVLDAADYLRAFSSDRRHMRAADGAELRPFPPWPAILDAEGRHLLPRLIDPSDAFLGEICDREGLRGRLAAPAREAT